MSQRFCVLPQGFSEGIALDCERHRHAKARQARDMESCGEIEFLDLHPVTNFPRYVWRPDAPQRQHIPAELMLRLAGTCGQHSGDRKQAVRAVGSHGSENEKRERMERRFVPLLTIRYSDDGLVYQFSSDAEIVPTANQVGVTFNLNAHPEAREAAATYLTILRPDGESARGKPPGSMAESLMRARRDALDALDRAWRDIGARYDAGPFSESLSSALASELPSCLLAATLRAYFSERVM